MTAAADSVSALLAEIAAPPPTEARRKAPADTIPRRA
jgi:hypothetical protein